ncbi:FAD-dependent oxidoreductase [Sphingomonas sp.]|uniref:FAD-dependent oxidoreductase n=1 Tax=Sphingomonas sp. TaxID=28214 RepID=UPI001ED34898|nr:FAD-dependent oxidoreductase [Sphingomonas sp.]MBX3592915.1 FAD-dependent oxidoreductase [Sphingomonas sp.]
MIRSATLGAGGLVLTGCATTAVRTAGAPTCLPKVDVSADRVIRTVAGLRPYRPAGFRVAREALGDTALVHNYGHGGAGITLSWGTSKLATALGLPGHQGPVAVIGAGVMALTTARLVQEAGFPVTLYAADLPPHTTSNIAGGQVHAYGHFDRDAVTPAWQAQLDTAYEYSVRRFQIMVGDDYGIRWLPTYAGGASRAGPHMPGFRLLERGAHPFAQDRVARYETMYVETGRFLRTLSRDIEIAGGRFVVRRFNAASEVAALPERLVFNCTGLGAGALFGDATLYPIRGQLAILVPQPEVRYAYNGPAGYMFPRADGILLGGTFEKHVADATPQPDDIAGIIASMRGLFDGFRCG